jgi:tetratricopeptide (TPR) repeat protein
MTITVREKTIEEIESKLSQMNTDLNKLSYLESALREQSFNYETKRFLWGQTSDLYKERKMYEKAAKAMANKASTEITIKDRIESFLSAAELHAKCGKIEESENMFIKAAREANVEQIEKIKLAKKNIYIVFAKELEKNNKKASAVKFYEKLIKMRIDPIEKTLIKEKLLTTYKSLGMFREAKLLEGIN